MEIKPIRITGQEVVSMVPDVRRDIHVFVQYIRERDVKRAHRTNMLSKGDSKRLAKLMSDPEAAQEVQEDGSSAWVDLVDDTSLKLGLVTYDTKGEYAGHTSSERSYPDNYIEFSEKAYKRFLALPPAQQELQLLDSMVNAGQGGESEFYQSGPLGGLDRFPTWGSATGIMPSLDFGAIRRFLLNVLVKCPVGQWLSTASLVQYLKAEHPYFLIPKNPKFPKNLRSDKQNRYGNFHESKKQWHYDIDIADTDEDAFQRVEGRYIERFLEGIPLILKYVDVTYAKKRPKAIYPSIGCLPAFRVNQRLSQALSGKITIPQVTVAPNFEVYVQADNYPAAILSSLAPLCELVSEDTTSTVLKLTKQKVAAARAADSKLNVSDLLQRLSDVPLPANVTRELSDWSEHSEKFVLHLGYSLLESDADLKTADPFTVEQVTPKIRLVRSANKLFQALEQQELAPLRVKHSDTKFTPLPKGAQTCFRKKAAQAKPLAVKTKVTLLRVTRVQLVCPNREFLDRLQGVLQDAKCPVQTDVKNLTIAYSKAHEAEVSKAIRALRKEYEVKIEDAG